MGGFLLFILSLLLIIVFVSIFGFLWNPGRFVGTIVMIILVLASMTTPLFPLVIFLLVMYFMNAPRKRD